MGTSNSYGGPGGNTPLVPSWLGDGSNIPSAPTLPPKGGKPDGTAPKVPKPNSKPAKPIVPPPTSDRFQAARTNFTKFAKSGGRNRGALGRAISGYVSKSVGGPRRAAIRMGSSRAVTIGLAGFLSSVQSQGVQQTLVSLNFQNLVGQPIEEIFLGLSDYICPDGGSVDEGISRNAFIETIADLAELGITDLDSLTNHQIKTVIEMFATHAIEARLCNDIGTKIIIAPNDIKIVERAQLQLHDFINRSVSDALSSTGANADLNNLKSIDLTKFVDRIYEDSFTILQSLAEAESDAV